ncbi:MAG TPA: hypothetical protein VE954_28970 [Oligoflexus sp.]|nr:hypothetical protein [Oligoflexus sp.]HYX37154.1 hypothetical protein [Oligoflexus sp.]
MLNVKKMLGVRRAAQRYEETMLKAKQPRLSDLRSDARLPC